MLRLWCLGRLIPSSEFSVLVCEVCANMAAFRAHMRMARGASGLDEGFTASFKTDSRVGCPLLCMVSDCLAL